MFHVEQSELLPSPPSHLEQVFGENTDKAIRYAHWLADQGTLRGLIGPREVPRIWDRHILNSAALAEVIDDSLSVVDVGSGAGLPGIPLALARADLDITLVEPLLRRTTFLQEVVEDLGIDVDIIRGRAEDKSVIKDVGGVDVVTSRAVAPLGKLTMWSLPLVKKGGQLIALKGSSIGEEVERDKDQIRKAHGGTPVISTVGEEILESPTHVVTIPRVK